MTPEKLTRQPTATGHHGRFRRRCGVVLAVSALGIAACADDRAAAPSDSPPASTGDGALYPAADLTIRHQAPQADVDVTYTLSCSSDGAEIGGDDVGVDAPAACEALTDPAVVDRLVEGAPQDQICTEQFGGEDVATVAGTIETATVDAAIDRANGCGISDWDDLLAPILPPAVGVR